LGHLGVGSERDHLPFFRIIDSYGGRFCLQKLHDALCYGPENVSLRVKGIDVKNNLYLTDEMFHVLIEHFVSDDVNDSLYLLERKVTTPLLQIVHDGFYKLVINLEVSHKKRSASLKGYRPFGPLVLRRLVS
jgi:hypothetical protein